MIQVSISPKSTVQVPYAVPAPGVLSYRVTSSRPVDSYLVNADGKAAYFQGQPMQALAMVREQTLHAQQNAIYFPGQFYLLVRNAGAEQADVVVDISFQPLAGSPGLSGSGAQGPFGGFHGGSF
jgi:hypothetical protein